MENNNKIFKIFDNYLNENEIQMINSILNKETWKHNTTSAIYGGTYGEVINTFFGIHNISESFFTEYLKSKIELEINTILNICNSKTKTCTECLNSKSENKKYTIKINRMYIHMQNYGEDGNYHYDDIGNDKITFCIYLNDVNNDEIENINGEFYLKIPEKKHIICIDTFYNRAILFKSEYLHIGMAYKKNTNKRICVTWKLQLIEMK
jgi:hypothetical protein